MPAAKHIRQQIREYMATLLTGLTTTTTNVFINRSNPLSLEDGEIPGLLIGADPTSPTTDRVIARSQGDQVTGRNRSTQRTMQFPVRGYHKLVSNIEDALDTIALEVETALGADPLLGGLATEVRLMDTTISTDGSGDKPIGEVVMNFEVDYWCVEGAPGVVLA